MLYRVLCFTILFATSGHAAAVNPPREVSDAPLIDELSLAALLYGFRYSAEDVPHPMNASQGNLMWDASGTGCVDGGAWDDPFPGRKGDLRSPVFCIPQPCAGLLSPEELSREVYGRPLEEGEYQTYLDRLEETCGALPDPAVDDLALGLEDYLRLASFQLVALENEDAFAALWPGMPVSPMAGAVRGGYFGPLAPVDYRTSLVPANLRVSSGGQFHRGSSDGGRWQSAGGTGRFGRTPARRRGGGGTPDEVSPFQPTSPVPPSFFPPTGPSDPRDPLGPGQPPLPPQTGGGDPSQPTPVPLAGGLPLLLSALGALAAGGGLRQRRRSRRELIG